MRPFRVVVTGSECTGKTTLARALAERFGAPWAAEFARAYFDAKGTPLDASDVEPIARGQVAGEDAAEAAARELLVLDTDLLSTAVYARHYYGSCPAWIEEAARARRADLYLLCLPDIPWEADAPRDRGDRREEMHGLFVGALDRLGAPAAAVSGTGEARLEAALAAVRAARERSPFSALPG